MLLGGYFIVLKGHIWEYLTFEYQYLTVVEVVSQLIILVTINVTMCLVLYCVLSTFMGFYQ